MLLSRGQILVVPRVLSDVDRQILQQLQRDGRKSYSHIARELGIDQRTVSTRLGELRETNVTHITVVGNPRALGYGSPALVGVRLLGTRSASETASALSTLDECPYVAATTGRYQLLAECFCVDHQHLTSVVAKIQRLLKRDFMLEVFPYVEVAYQQIHFEAAYQKRERMEASLGALSGGVAPVDARIIEGLVEDGRKPFRAIAEELGISEAHVRQRFQRVVNSGAVRVQAIVNPKTFGFESTAWLGIKLDRRVGGSRVVAEALSARRGFAYVARCLGRFDIFAEVLATDEFDLEQIIEEGTEKIAGIIAVEPFVYLELHYKPVKPFSRTEGDAARPAQKGRGLAG